MELKEIIAQLHTYGKQDPLVNLEFSSAKFFPLAPTTNTYAWKDIQQLLKESDSYFKQSGIHSLCTCTGTLSIASNTANQTVPIWLHPVRYKRNKLHDEVELFYDTDGFLNPYLNQLFSSYQINLPNWNNAEDAFAFLTELAFGEVNQKVFVLGNFHPFRHDLIRDSEWIQEVGPSDLVRLLLEGDTIHTTEECTNSIRYLYEADTDQKKALSAVFSQAATVIQGPPGTGKSQVIANICANAILHGKRILISSQKRVALEVIQQKLAAVGLGDLCFIASSQTQPKELIASLKENWLRLEQETIQPANSLFLSENLHDQLQYKLDIYHKDRLIGGISLRSFLENSKQLHLTETPFHEDLPSILELKEHQSFVAQIYREQLHHVLSNLSVTAFDERIFGGLKKEVITLQREWELLKEYEVYTLEQLYDHLKLSIACQEFSRPYVGPYIQLYRSASKEQKTFLRLEKKWNQLYPKYCISAEENKHWKIHPTRESLHFLEKCYQKKSLFSSYRFNKKWKEYSLLPSSNPLRTIEKAKDFLELETELLQLRGSLAEIGIYAPENDLSILSHAIRSNNFKNMERLSVLSDIERERLAASNANLNACLQRTKSIIRLSPNAIVNDQIATILEKIDNLVIHKNSLQKLTGQLLRCISIFNSYSDLEKGIYKHAWIRFLQEFPAMQRFNEVDFLRLSEQIISEEEKESQILISQIRNTQIRKYKSYEDLLKRVPAKLTGEEKQLRSALKNGKRILVKEFSKSRNHQSLHALFASDARYWIELIHPIWLCNPIILARIFPITMRFDIGIMDEASQVTIGHGIGLVQRSNRIVICGDEQQMSPSNYFQTGTIESPSILSQALFYFPSLQLSQHYRSEHPLLIQFSNQHFYGNRLQTIPNKSFEIKPIEWVFMENGIYENGINQSEVKRMVELLQENLKKKEKIGVVAFSENQIQTIQQAAEKVLFMEIQEAMQEDRLFFKALENVQGDECDHLLISFGYGFNAEGKFSMRFGPVNLANGPRRLNVLFSRAKRKITFLSSVSSSNFKLSSNTGVSLLRDWFLFMEQHQNTDNVDFQPKINNFHNYHTNSTELVDFVRLLKKRGW